MSGLSARGEWPGLVELRHGWAKARARPWNDQVGDASLRIDRGSSRFLGDCATWLVERGATAVLSPPLHPNGASMWQRAGFLPHLQLAVYHRSLVDVHPNPQHDQSARTGTPAEWEMAIAIDEAAFDLIWRLGHLGLAESRGATPRSVFLVTGRPGDPDGFAIVGVGGGTGYLQRIAVWPDRQRKGAGTALLRASMQWARRQGGLTMLLNTQPDNAEAARLYTEEGFSLVGTRLQVMRWPHET